MAVPAFAVVCVWCNRTISAAPAGAPITQTICSTCVDWSMRQSLEFKATSRDIEYFELPPRPVIRVAPGPGDERTASDVRRSVARR